MVTRGGSVDFKTRVVPGVLIGGVVLAGGGSVIAASGGSSSTESASSVQYCPDGTPKPPNGDCSGHGGNNGGGNPGGPGEHPKPPHKHKHHKKPRFHVHRNPHRSCYSGNIGFRIGVANLPKRHKTRVYRDGHFVTMSGKSAFKVHFNTRHMSRGMHTLTLRLRGSDGKWYTYSTSFRHC
jgi:hypothetical protein